MKSPDLLDMQNGWRGRAEAHAILPPRIRTNWRPRLRGRAEKSFIQDPTKALMQGDGMIQHSLDTSPFLGNHLWCKRHSNKVLNLIVRSLKEDERISSSLSASPLGLTWIIKYIQETDESIQSSVLFSAWIYHIEQKRTDSGLHLSVMCLPLLGWGHLQPVL